MPARDMRERDRQCRLIFTLARFIKRPFNSAPGDRGLWFLNLSKGNVCVMERNISVNPRPTGARNRKAAGKNALARFIPGIAGRERRKIEREGNAVLQICVVIALGLQGQAERKECIMPRGDGTGPVGMGPMTGRAAGFCAGNNVPGYQNLARGQGYGMGFGGGRSCGRGRRNRFLAGGFSGQFGLGQGWGGVVAEPTSERQAEALRAQSEAMEQALAGIRRRLAELAPETK